MCLCTVLSPQHFPGFEGITHTTVLPSSPVDLSTFTQVCWLCLNFRSIVCPCSLPCERHVNILMTSLPSRYASFHHLCNFFHKFWNSLTYYISSVCWLSSAFIKHRMALTQLTQVEKLGKESLINCAKTSMSSKIIGPDSDFFAKLASTSLNYSFLCHCCYEGQLDLIAAKGF